MNLEQLGANAIAAQRAVDEVIRRSTVRQIELHESFGRRERLLEIFTRIAGKEPGHVHGDFLTCFAEAYIRADVQNAFLLEPAALALIKKYNLDGEAA